MSDYLRRLDRIESVIAPKLAPLVCIIFGNADEAEAVARFRVSRHWPDDGAHPVRLIRVEWVASGGADG